MKLQTCMVFLCLAVVLAVAPLASAASISWNGASGSWGTSTSWNPATAVPTSLDNVTANINGGAVITLGQNWEVNSFINSNGDYAGDLGLSGTETNTYQVKIWSGNITTTGGTAQGMGQAGYAANYRIHAGVELGNNGTWNISGKAIQIDGPITGAYSITKTGAGALIYTSTLTSPSFTDLTINAGEVHWNYKPGNNNAFTGNLGTGTITINNGAVFDVAATASAGTANVVKITNAITIGSTGGKVQAYNYNFGSVTFSGTLALGGALTFAPYGYNPGWDGTQTGSMIYSGTIVVDQSAVGQRIIVANEAGTTSGRCIPSITGNIVDGAGSAGNPLFIKASDYRPIGNPYHLNLGGNGSYSNGTIIDSPTSWNITSDGGIDGNSGLVNVTDTTATDTPLGSGLTTVLAGGRLRLASSLNVPGKVSVQTNNLMLGVLSLNFAANSASLSSLVTADSSGVLGFMANTQTFATLDQSTVGNGKMFFGADEASTAVISATTILPGKDDVGGLNQTYRFGGGQGNGITLNMKLSQTASQVIIGDPRVNGAGVVTMGSGAQTYNQGTTVNVGSTLYLTCNGGTPVGTGTVTLNGGAMGTPGAYYSGTNTVAGGVVFSSASSFFSIGQSNSNNTWSVDHFTRSGQGMLFLGLGGQAPTYNRILVVTGTPGHTNPNAAMVDPYVNFGSSFADYLTTVTNSRLGYVGVTYTGTQATLGSWTSDTIADCATAATLAGPTNVWALRMNNVGMNLNGNTLTISSGGLIMYGASGAAITSGTGTLSFATTTGTPVEAVITYAGMDQPNRVFTIDPVITNAAGITIGCGGGFAGAVKLSNASNSFTGDITVNSGWLEFAGNSGVFGNVANRIVLNGGGLELNAAGSFTTTREIVLGAANGHVYATGANTLVLGGTISGTGMLDINSGIRTYYNGGLNTSGGTVVLSGNNSYAGGTIIRNAINATVNATSSLGTGDVQVESGCTLNLKGTQNIADTALLTVSYGGVVNLQSAGETIGGLAGPGQVNLGAPAGGGSTVLTLGGNQSSTFFGTLAQTGTAVGSLVKGGTGTLTWRGIRSYTGSTTVANGTLDVVGPLSGNVNVASQDGIVSPILKLSNNLAGNVTVTGGLISVGTAPTIKTIGGLSFSTTTVASQVELDTFSNSQTAGVGYDRLVVTGTANMNNSQLLIKIAPTTNFIGDVMTILTSGSDMTGETLSAKFIGGFGTLAISPDGHSVTLSKIAYAGDADQDGTVGGSDYTQWLNNFGVTGATWTQADLDGDGTVGGSDYAIWLNNFGVSQSDYGPAGVPEPATMCLLALGGAALLRRRK